MIKWIAVLLMVIDHIGYYFGFLMPNPVFIVLRLIGRLSFPLFAYSIAAGFLRTKNRTRYFTRMFVFAAVTQALLAVTSYFTGIGAFINVMFTFSLAILMMASSELLSKSLESVGRKNTSPEEENHRQLSVEIRGHGIPPAAAGVTAVLSIFLILAAATYFEPDYSLFGVLTVYLFYYIQKRVRKPDLLLSADSNAVSVMVMSFLALNLISALFKFLLNTQPVYWILLEIFSVFSIAFLLMDKPRKRPGAMEKYFFYAFYPLHLVLFMLLQFYFMQR